MANTQSRKRTRRTRETNAESRSTPNADGPRGMNENSAFREVLLNEYYFMQKAYELQFTHFMGVFYFWIPVVTLPTSAGVLANLGSRPVHLGLLFCFIALIGFFLTAKMFDIRRSQVRYLERINKLRAALWGIYEVEGRTRIAPMGREADLTRIALTDFGRTMAITMSAVHATLTGIGLWNVLTGLGYDHCTLLLAVAGGLIVSGLNLGAFFWIVGHRPQVQ